MSHEHDEMIRCHACDSVLLGGTLTKPEKEELSRLRKLFDDAGQGEHNVLALVEHYQRGVSEAEDKLSAVAELLTQNGCDCECDHHHDECGDDCERCLACRISEVLQP